MTTGYHENGLSGNTEDLHRGFASLVEEIEAADWYTQRIDVCRDETLKAALEHNRDEELEHAAMLIEWLRRMLPRFDEQLRLHLFTTGPISEEGEGLESEKTSPKSQDLGIRKIEE
jgi:ferritin-like protein